MPLVRRFDDNSATISDDTELAIYRLLFWRAAEGELGRDAFGRGPTILKLTATKWRIGNDHLGYPERKITNRQASAIARGAFTLYNVPKNDALPNVWPKFTDPKTRYRAPVERKPAVSTQPLTVTKRGRK